MTFATSASASDTPVPIAATIALATGAWSVQFDQQLQPGMLNPANWTLRASGNTWAVSMAAAAGDTVSGASGLSFPNPGPDVANYLAIVPDVFDLFGRPAPGFTDFPLVVT